MGAGWGWCSRRYLDRQAYLSKRTNTPPQPVPRAVWVLVSGRRCSRQREESERGECSPVWMEKDYGLAGNNLRKVKVEVLVTHCVRLCDP